MSADWVQAIGVLVSFAIAGLGYIQARRSAARTALRKILNMADEFPLLIDDEARYKYFLNEDHADDVNKIDYSIWIEEVESFSEEFRNDLNGLWAALDNLHLVPWSKDSYSDTLNSGNLVRKSLERTLFVLQTEDIEAIQGQKEFTARVLLNFSNELYQLAQTTRLIPSNNLASLYQSLKCYVANNKVVFDAIWKFRKSDVCHLTTLPKGDPKANGEPWFYLSNMYGKDVSEVEEQPTGTYSWKALREKIKISDVDLSLRKIFNRNTENIKDERVKSDLAKDIVKQVAKREALKYGDARFKLRKAHPQYESDKYRVIFDKINYQFKKRKIKSHFRDLDDPKSWRPGYVFSDIACNFHSRKYPKLAR